MIISLVRRTVVCAGSLVLFVSLTGLPVMADGKKLAPDIVEVQTMFGDDPGAGTCFPEDDTIAIIGENLSVGIDPVVFLGAHGPLTVCSSSPNEVVVQCPSGICGEGDFRLTLVTDQKGKRFDVYDLTIGAVGPQGPKGDKGDRGDTGPQGDQGSQGIAGVDGADGVSVISSTLPVGDPNCPNGGSRFDSVTGTTFACNGAQGPEGPAGADGADGQPGADGAAAFVGLMCPPGEFVAGFNLDGTLKCLPVDPAPTVLFDVTFSSPEHTVGLPPVTGGGSTQPSSGGGGTTVVSAVGTLDDQPVLFEEFQVSIINFNIGAGADRYTLEFDLILDELAEAGANSAFTVFVDAPTVNTLAFNSGNGFQEIRVANGLGSTRIGRFALDTPMHVSMDIDMIGREWTIEITGALDTSNVPIALLTFTSPLGGSEDVVTMRFALNLPSTTAVSRVGLDNIRITAGP